MCADMGSSIVDYLKILEKPAVALSDAFADDLLDDSDMPISWGVTNPPYDRSKVLKILERQVERVRQQTLIDGGLHGFATLMRTAFDHGKAYRKLFESKFYSGQIKLCFRPYWTDERHVMPFHSYAWHIWTFDKQPPLVRHYYPEPDPNYKVIAKGDRVRVNRGGSFEGYVGTIFHMDKDTDGVKIASIEVEEIPDNAYRHYRICVAAKDVNIWSL
jgi:hypothetical protein